MANYTYQVQTTTELILAKASQSDLKFVASGGVAEVYQHDNAKNQCFALKIYRKPNDIDWAKIAYQSANPIEGLYSVVDPTPSKFAWPLSIITSGNKNVGIAMPYVDRTDYITLDNWVEYHLLQRISPENDSLSRRLLILANLAKALAEVHAKAAAAIDLKPANTLVNLKTADTCLLDCDSFLISKDDGTSFPGSHFSPGYILPEAIGSKINVSGLDQEQDRYAYSVMAFQVLNYGIHPFQGILRKNIPDTGTNDEKAAKGLYAYGEISSQRISPLPQSIHTTWPKELRNLFDRAFARHTHRAPISEWEEYFRKLLRTQSLARCDKHPDSVRHIKFDGQECGACKREAAINKILGRKLPEEKISKSSPTPAQRKSVPTPVTPRQQKAYSFFKQSSLNQSKRAPTPVTQRKKTGGIPGWLMVGGLGIVALFISNKLSNIDYQTQSPDTTKSPSFAAKTRHKICQQALTNDKTDWDYTTSLFRKYANEAKRRGLTINDCRRVLRLSQIAPSTTQSTQTATNDLTVKTDSYICGSALAPDRKRWDSVQRYQSRVEEAKRRGLTINDCRRVLRLSQIAPSTTQSTQTATNDLTVETDSYICGSALANDRKRWDGVQRYQSRVEEAKRRGLTINDCRRVLNLLPIATQTPTIDLTAKTDSSICGSALTSSRKHWDSRPSYQLHVQEAKRRGLTVNDCRRELGYFISSTGTTQASDSKPENSSTYGDWMIVDPVNNKRRFAKTLSKEGSVGTYLGVFIEKDGTLLPKLVTTDQLNGIPPFLVTLREDNQIQQFSYWYVETQWSTKMILPPKLFIKKFVNLIKNGTEITITITDENEDHSYTFSLRGSAKAISALK